MFPIIHWFHYASNFNQKVTHCIDGMPSNTKLDEIEINCKRTNKDIGLINLFSADCISIHREYYCMWAFRF